VRELVLLGHQVHIETNAGHGIGISDQAYENAGAKIISTAAEIFQHADMIIKVKELQSAECAMLRENQVLFTYLHLAPDPQQTQALIQSRCIAIAYETVTDSHGGLPLLAPMSEVAGRMSIQAGARCLEKAEGGRGVLLGGVPGVASARVLVIGGGVVGTNAVRMAMGMEARVTVIDKSIQRLKELDMQFGSKINTIYSTRDSIEHYASEADLVIGAVLIPGAAAPKLLTRDIVKKMHEGSVIVDVAIDQGGCCETSHPTTHAEPTYIVDGVIHYCVANMPGAVARTAAFALNNATLPFIIQLAEKGYKKALLDNPHLLQGLNVYRGQITHHAVATALKAEHVPATLALSD
jgi:alanine dehydrogenase